MSLFLFGRQCVLFLSDLPISGQDKSDSFPGCNVAVCHLPRSHPNRVPIPR
jgi:hypothetical protein